MKSDVFVGNEAAAAMPVGGLGGKAVRQLSELPLRSANESHARGSFSYSDSRLAAIIFS